MVQENSITKVAFTGNTDLTFKCIKAILSESIHVSAIFGLSDAKLKGKTNHINLVDFCESNGIKLFTSENWEEFKSFCLDDKVDVIITMGDSRIIPKTITDSFYVIGNHGAILPDVKGGASLVWGRLLNNGSWGISIMEIDEGVDTGKVLKTKRFSYSDEMSEEEFVTKCDDLTVDALLEVMSGDHEQGSNRGYDVRVSKHTDSEKAVEILKYCLENNLCVYMPPRTKEDSVIKSSWSDEFIDVFKIAQNKPYPVWSIT